MGTREYADLLDVLGDVSMEGYCDHDYTTWEQKVAEPRLKELGYEVKGWMHGEYDSFGPLSRIVVTNRGKLIYF